MFCWNCGKPVEDGQKFCAVCGAAQNQQPAPAQPAPAQPAPVQPAPVAEERGTEILTETEERGTEILTEPEERSTEILTEPEERGTEILDQADPYGTAVLSEPQVFAPFPTQPEAVATPDFSVNSFAPEKPKKKKKKLGGLIAALVVVAALAGSAVFFWPYITSLWNRTFLAPEKYLVKVYEKNLEKDSVLAPVSDAYGALRNVAAQTSSSNQVDLALSVDESLINMLESAVGGNADLSWFKSVALSLSTNITDDGEELSMGVGLNDTRVMTVKMIIDYAGKLYAGVPEVSDTYLAVDVSGAQLEEKVGQLAAANAQLAKQLPSEEAFTALTNKYITLALSQLKDVDKSTKKVEVGDISETYTLLEAEISEEDAVKMAIAILKEAKKDKELRKIVTAFAEYAVASSEIQGYGSAEVDVDALFSDLDAVIEEMEEYADQADDEPVLVITTYVNMKDEICGYALEDANGDEVIFFLTARKGDKFEFEAEIAKSVLITGSGTEKKDVVNATYTVEAEDQEIIVLDLKNFTTAETISGIVRVSPGKALTEQISQSIGNSGVGTLMSGTDMALELEFGKSSVDMRFMTGKTALVSLKMTYKSASATKIQTPSDTVSVSSMYEVSSWVRSLNLDNIASNLEDAGVPSEIASYLRTALNNWKKQLSNNLRYY